MSYVQNTSLQMVADLLENTEPSTIRVASKSISVRFPIQLLAQLDAMANVADKSRSVMLFHIVQIGLDEVMKAASSKAKKRISARTIENLSQLAESLDLDPENLEG